MVSGNGCGRPAIASGVFALVVGILLAGQSAAAPRSTDPRLSATLEHGAGGSRHDGCAWQPGFTIADLDGNVGAMTVFDDGSGPALYAGGSFTTAGGVIVNRIARWNGTEWSALTALGGTGVSGGVSALTFFDDGTGPALYAGGFFATAGGVTVNNVARWDGTAWSSLSGPSGGGTNGLVSALVVFDDGTGPALYAAGYFTTAGGVTVSNVARWDGTVWSALSGPSGTGVDSGVYELATFDDGTGSALFAGGRFRTAGGALVNNAARWVGSSWSPLSGPSGTGTGGSSAGVQALATYDDGSGSALYFGGDFILAGGETVYNIARWDGAGWSGLTGPSGTGTYHAVSALAAFDDGSSAALYVGGAFITAGGVTVNRIARWDGETWSALGGPSGIGMDGPVYALCVFDDGSGPALYAGGNFDTAGGVTVNGVARWDGAAWSALTGPQGTGLLVGYATALVAFDDGSGPALYAGGAFSWAGGVPAHRLARWDGATWSAVGGQVGTDSGEWVNALAVHDDGFGAALYAGGSFLLAGGMAVSKIARWDGVAWSALSGPEGEGVDGFVQDLVTFEDAGGPALYVGGSFTTAGGLPSARVAAWRCAGAIFADGFESGTTAGWNDTVP